MMMPSVSTNSIRQPGWLPDCEDTLSHQATGRSDWETIQAFYPWLNYTEPENPGPDLLPLAVTQIEIIEPNAPETALDVPIYYLKKDRRWQHLSAHRTRQSLSCCKVIVWSTWAVRPIPGQRPGRPGRRNLVCFRSACLSRRV